MKQQLMCLECGGDGVYEDGCPYDTCDGSGYVDSDLQEGAEDA